MSWFKTQVKKAMEENLKALWFDIEENDKNFVFLDSKVKEVCRELEKFKLIVKHQLATEDNMAQMKANLNALSKTVDLLAQKLVFLADDIGKTYQPDNPETEPLSPQLTPTTLEELMFYIEEHLPQFDLKKPNRTVDEQKAFARAVRDDIIKRCPQDWGYSWPGRPNLRLDILTWLGEDEGRLLKGFDYDFYMSWNKNIKNDSFEDHLWLHEHGLNGKRTEFM